jgi:hypothetical protein
MSLFSDLSWKSTDKLGADELNRRAKALADAIEALRAFAPDWEREVNSLRELGLQRIDEALLPAFEQITALTYLGLMLSATSTSSVEIGEGVKAFVIPEEKRRSFAPTPYLIAYADGDFSKSVVGKLSSYDHDTGELVVEVDDARGEGTFASWTIGPIATTDDLEELRDQVTAKSALAVSSAVNAGVSAANASNALGALQQQYLGSHSTDPATKTNGAALTVGTLYTNSATGQLRYFGAGGWRDAIGASNVVSHTFTTDGRGTSPYSLPIAPISKQACLVFVDGVLLASSAYSVIGVNLSFASDPGDDKAVEVRIISQLSVGSPSDESVTAAKINTAGVAAILTKLGVDGLYPRADAEQSLTPVQKGRARANIGAPSVWQARAGVGGYYLVDNSVAGVEVPPSLVGDEAVWVQLTAGLREEGQFNYGKLASEAVSGSAPNVLATAVISLAGSPLDGRTIRLLNTEGRILRPYITAGTALGDAIRNITGQFGFATGGFATRASGAFSLSGTENTTPVTGNIDGSPRVDFDASTQVPTANENRMKMLGVTAYMRIR